MPCAAAGLAADGISADWTLSLALGEERSVAFTACDFEASLKNHSIYICIYHSIYICI